MENRIKCNWVLFRLFVDWWNTLSFIVIVFDYGGGEVWRAGTAKIVKWSKSGGVMDSPVCYWVFIRDSMK